MFGVITLVFVLFNILPGDPARMMLGQRADEKSIEAIHKELGLDKPLHHQYCKYIYDLSHFDLRRSYQSGKPVVDILKEAFPNTIYLALLSITIAFVLGVTLGSLAAVFQRWVVGKNYSCYNISWNEFAIFFCCNSYCLDFCISFSRLHRPFNVW